MGTEWLWRSFLAMGNGDFLCFYLSQASSVTCFHERACEWSEALISSYLDVQFMSPITLPLTRCLPGHLDLLPYHKGFLPYRYMADRSYHIMSTYLVTYCWYKQGLVTQRGQSVWQRHFSHMTDSICLCDRGRNTGSQEREAVAYKGGKNCFQPTKKLLTLQPA